MAIDKNNPLSESIGSLSDEIKNELVTESKGLLYDLLNHFFGDFKNFMTIFKTTGYWFIKPLSIDIFKNQDPGSKFMGDLRLVKSLFLLLVIFLALDTGVTGDEATMNEYVMRITYLVLFVVSLVLFLFIGKIWMWLAGGHSENQRVFQGYLLYEFCTLFFIQGVVTGLLKISVWDYQNDDFILSGTIFAIIIPLVHSLYFFFKLGRNYQARRKFLGLAVILFIVGFYLIFPAVWNDLSLKQGLLTP